MERFLWPLVIFHIIVGIVGLPGNTLIILVCSRKRQIMSPHVFILALAVADLIVCLFTPVTVYHWYNRLNYTSDFLCRLVVSVTFVTVYNSCFLTSAIAVDRYQAICRPHRRWMTVRRAKIAAVVCSVLAVLISVPVFASYDISPYGQVAESGECAISKNVPTWLIHLMTTIIYTASLCTLVVNIVLYGMTYRAIRKQVTVRPGQDSANGSTTSHTLRRTRFVPTVSGLSSQSHQAELNVNTCDQVLSTSGQNLAVSSQDHGRRQKHPERHIHNLQPQQQQKTEKSAKFIHKNSPKKSANWLSSKTTSISNLNGNQRQQRRFRSKTTKMLVITTAVFFATWLVALVIVSLPQHIHKYIYESNQVGYSFLYLFKYGFYLNNAVNPFIYGFVNKQFRVDMRKTLSALRCCWHNSNRATHRNLLN
ncbi:D(2) dopamine receptor-like [Acanthaster planci]|uniref:D(2) dopamine receptor-like n=1 Tax=Acanthaster planci TaxID=133434 RepID=A0A8B7ZU66_ACAPL|nr:D(2) dopamine receptor-like [Acanthaster planci]